MDIRQLQYIATLAEYRSFTKAAKALFIAQPSLSAYVAKTEAELGVTLFDRSTTPLTLTYAGEEYLKRAEEILSVHHLMEKEMQDLSQQRVGRIRVGMPPERAAYMLPLLLPAYKKLYPGMDVQLVTAHTTGLDNYILRSKVDLAILPANPWDSGIASEALFAEELLLVGDRRTVRPEHLLEGVPNTVDPRALEDIPLILLGVDRGIRIFIDRMLEKQGIHPHIAMEVDSNIVAYRLATVGLGAAIIPRTTLSLTQAVNPTPVYSISACRTTWQIVAAYRRDAYRSEAERRFVAVARAVFHEAGL